MKIERTKICIPISEKTPEKLLKKISVAQKAGAEVIEIWLGELDSCDEDVFIKILAAAKGIPLLANCKNEKEKGSFSGTDTEKIKRLLAASQAGFSFVDCDTEISDELLAIFREHQNPATKLILSAHFWEGTPAIHGLLRTAEKMRAKGADLLKFATTPKNFRDLVVTLRLAEKLSSKNIPHIVIAMDAMGKMTRFFAPDLGNEMTFAALDEQSATAPGQVSVKKLKDFFAENF